MSYNSAIQQQYTKIKNINLVISNHEITSRINSEKCIKYIFPLDFDSVSERHDYEEIKDTSVYRPLRVKTCIHHSHTVLTNTWSVSEYIHLTILILAIISSI